MKKRSATKIKQSRSLCSKIKDGLIGNIKLIKRIGTKSVDGEVYKACYPLNCKNKIAVKKIEIPVLDEEQKGYAKNFLRKDAVNSDNPIWAELTFLTICTEFVKKRICPNLPMYFRYDYCNRCPDTTRKSCVYISNELADGDLKNFLGNCNFSFDELVSCYYQILLGLYTLKLRIKLQHNDLHQGNVLFHNLKKNSTGACKRPVLTPKEYFRYKINEGGDYIDVPIYDKLFVIWDFGRSFIKGKIEPDTSEVKDSSVNPDDLFEDFNRIIEQLPTRKTDVLYSENQRIYRETLYALLIGIWEIAKKKRDISLMISLLPRLKREQSKIKKENVFDLTKKYVSKHDFINKLI